MFYSSEYDRYKKLSKETIQSRWCFVIYILAAISFYPYSIMLTAIFLFFMTEIIFSIFLLDTEFDQVNRSLGEYLVDRKYLILKYSLLGFCVVLFHSLLIFYLVDLFLLCLLEKRFYVGDSLMRGKNVCTFIDG